MNIEANESAEETKSHLTEIIRKGGETSLKLGI